MGTSCLAVSRVGRNPYPYTSRSDTCAPTHRCPGSKDSLIRTIPHTKQKDYLSYNTHSQAPEAHLSPTCTSHPNLQPTLSPVLPPPSSPYKLAFCPPTVPTPSRCTIKSLVKKSEGHSALICANMYSDAILTCSALMPGNFDTLADSSEKIGSR